MNSVRLVVENLDGAFPHGSAEKRPPRSFGCLHFGQVGWSLPRAPSAPTPLWGFSGSDHRTAIQLFCDAQQVSAAKYRLSSSERRFSRFRSTVLQKVWL